MEIKMPEIAANPEEELRKLRKKSDRDELSELKRGVLGGYNSRQVALYVARLKEQLQTAEKTFKNHIAELSADKDQLRMEKEALQSRLAVYENAPAGNTNETAATQAEDAAMLKAHTVGLKSELQQAKRAAEGFLADKGKLEEKLQSLSSLADENVALMKEQLSSQEEELKQVRLQCEALKADKEEMKAQLNATMKDAETNAAALANQIRETSESLEQVQQRCDSLLADNEALQGQIVSKAEEYGNKAAEMLQCIAQMEGHLAEDENAAEEFGRQLDESERKIDKMTEEALQLSGQLSAIRLENCTLNGKVDSLVRENSSLTAQLDIARQNILNLLSDKETIEVVNKQMRNALNSLLVKADALIKENDLISGQLEAERDRVQQYQTVHGRLTDMLTRVRSAYQLLDERVVDMDKAMSFGSGQMGKPHSATMHRRSTKSEMLDFSGGRNAALQDIIGEISTIQANLAQQEQLSELFSGQPDTRLDMDELLMQENEDMVVNSR